MYRRPRCLRSALIAALLAPALACPSEEPPDDGIPDWPELSPGTLSAGAATGFLDLPVGIPMAGYTGRDRALGSDPGPDSRDSDYRTDFVPSGGWQTRIPMSVLWMDDGTRDAVLVRVDLIYSYDGLTEALGEELSARSGRALQDSVFTFTNHSHSSYGPFTKSTILFFGGDFYREEVFDRMVAQLADLAMEAYEGLRPARAGLGVDPDFDPIGEDRIFRDRRAENDGLPAPDGSPTGPGWKDQRATLLRVDGTDGVPIAALFDFGMHGTVMGGDNPLLSSEGPGHIATLLQQRHPGPVWIFAQGAGGDASPAGQFDDFARMEWLAEEASVRILALWEQTETAPGPLTLEPLQRYVTQGRDIRVSRNGTTDLRYLPWDPAWGEDPEGYRPDLLIWEDDGVTVRSPIDEFWPQYGAALCGGADVDVAILGLNLDLPQYKSCLDVEKAYALFHIAFDQYFVSRDDYPLPLPESRTSMLGALGIRSIPVTYMGEAGQTRDVVLAFAPGEPCTLWTQTLRYRAEHEKGVAETMLVGYAMDHEGYLLTVEDWLMAGYEPSITVWGPLQGEYLLERLLDLVGIAGTSVGEDAAWPDFPTSTWYPDWVTPFVEPDVTPDAGTVPDVPPAGIYTRDHQQPETAQPFAQIERVRGIARFTFWGSDPATGMLRVAVEREQTPGAEDWAELTTPAGTPVTDALPDVVVTYTPYPLQGSDADPDPVRQHLYHVEWQAVDLWPGLDSVPALPLGRYRFAVTGLARDPADPDYPYETIPWSLASEPFELVPAQVDLVATLDAQVLNLRASYAAAGRGFRLLHKDADPRGPTPLHAPGDTVHVTIAPAAGGAAVLDEDVSVTSDGSGSLGSLAILQVGPGSWTVTLDDGHGNLGTAALELPE
jgi:neutral ceramidase